MNTQNIYAERTWSRATLYLEMRAVFLGLLVCSLAGVLHAQLVSPSMLHHVTLEGTSRSEGYHIYSNFTSGYCGEYDDSQRVYMKEDLEIPGSEDDST
jgi:hypothetical protein